MNIINLLKKYVLAKTRPIGVATYYAYRCCTMLELVLMLVLTIAPYSGDFPSPHFHQLDMTTLVAHT